MGRRAPERESGGEAPGQSHAPRLNDARPCCRDRHLVRAPLLFRELPFEGGIVILRYQVSQLGFIPVFNGAGRRCKNTLRLKREKIARESNGWVGGCHLSERRPSFILVKHTSEKRSWRSRNSWRRVCRPSSLKYVNMTNVSDSFN